MKNITLKRLVDIALILDIIISASTPIKFAIGHEIFGFLLIFLTDIHLYLNREWIENVFHMRTIRALVLAIINLLLFATLVLLALAGISLSRIFNDILIFTASTARTIHLGLSFWMIVLSGIHLGFNWNLFIPRNISKRFSDSKFKPYLLTLIFAIALYGAWTFNANHIAEYMFFMRSYMDYEYLRNFFLALLNNTSVFVLWAFLGFQINRFLIAREKANH